MGFRDDNAKKQARRYLFFRIFWLSIFIFVFFLIIRFSWFDNFLVKTYSPVWKLVDRNSVLWQSEFLPATTSKKKLWQENNLLKKTLEENIINKNKLTLVESENTRLRDALNNFSTIGLENPILASVISVSGIPWYGTLLIQIPVDRSISRGDMVYSEGDVLLGYIDSVDNNIASVRLFSAVGEIIEVSIFPSGIRLDAIGRGAGNYEIHLPREIELLSGDILTSPVSSLVQIAIVGETVFDPRDPYQTILATMPVNPMQLHEVYVIPSN